MVSGEKFRSDMATWRLPSPKQLTAAVAALVLVQLVIIGGVGQRPSGAVLSDIAQLAGGVICIVACCAAFQRSRSVVRYAWRFLVVTFLIWTFAQGLAVYVDFSGRHPFDVADEIIFFLDLIPFGMLAFLDPEEEPDSFDRLHIFDFVQVAVFWFSIFLSFSPLLWSPTTSFRLGPFVWSRNIAFATLLGLTFVCRAVLTRSTNVRKFFLRMALFLTLSGLADSYALNPENNTHPGGWFDLIWTALLVFPILIAANWKETEREEGTRKSARPQNLVMTQFFPVLYPLLNFLILAHVSRGYPRLSLAAFAVSSAAFVMRVLVIQHRQQKTEEKYRTIFEDAVIGIFQSRSDGSFASVNGALVRILGYDSPEQLMAEGSNLLSDLFVQPSQEVELRHAIEENEIIRNAELEVYGKDRTSRWVLANIRAVRDTNGKIELVEGTIEDITDRKRAEGRVQFLAYYDALTGLANRILLQDRLTKALASARRRNDKVALLFVDLDRFKLINDSLGHSFGDLLLQQVAERLKKWAREQDTVARIGGDEFLIVATGIEDVQDVGTTAERLLEEMNKEFVIQGRRFHISCSIGICIFPEHGADSEALVKNADAAMYSAKENGRNSFRFFSEDMNEQVLERLNIEHGLREAIEDNQFFLVYQPQIEIATGRIVAIEALLRWKHPKLGTVPPGKFIQVAENSGLIVPIGEWVLRTACSAMRDWQDRGIISVPVSVNVSAAQFRHGGFRDLVNRVLLETRLGPQYLELELTESLLMSNAEVMLSLLRSLKAMEIKLAIDDFGTGYSSLAYLRQFPVSKIKIDRSFIYDVAENPDSAAISTAVISMAKGLNLRVVAEGVENSSQMDFLRTHRCDDAQGYLISKPLSADEIARQIKNPSRLALSASSSG